MTREPSPSEERGKHDEKHKPAQSPTATPRSPHAAPPRRHGCGLAAGCKTDGRLRPLSRCTSMFNRDCVSTLPLGSSILTITYFVPDSATSAPLIGNV